MITIDDEIFLNNGKAIEFCLEKNILKSFLICNRCGSSMSLCKNSRKLNSKEYKCRNNTCKSTKSIFLGFRDVYPQIEIKKILLCGYYYILELSNYQVTILTGICEKTYIKLKKIFLKRIYQCEMQNSIRSGGEGVVFQVDETAVCRRGLITNPSSLEMEIRDTVWLIGLIQENTPTNLILEVLPDRTISTFTDFFMRNVLPGSIIKSDGYPSYPSSIKNAGCIHHIVNHSEGFINAEGEHTNKIENVWSHFKTELKTRRGVMYTNMKYFAQEFVIFKKYNAKRSREHSSIFFLFLIRSLVED